MSPRDAAVAEDAFDVESLYARRADRRWERVSVGDVFERLTWSAPDRTVLIAAGSAIADPLYERLTARGADEAANRVANALLAEGLQRGDRVALYCENSVEAVVTKIGIAKAGGVAVPINVALARDVVEYVLRRVGAQLGVVDADLAAACAASFAAAGARVVACIRGSAEPTATDWSQWIAGASADEPDVRIAGDDVWEILHTSGTTAMPKGAMITHHSTHYTALSFALSLTRGLALESELRTCSFLPVVYHVGDHVWPLSPLMTGGSAVIGRGVDHAAVARAITDERVTALWGGSPALVADLVQTVRDAPEGTYDLRSLKVLTYGWSSLRPDVMDDLQRLCDGVEIMGIFGQTEAIACHRYFPRHHPGAGDRDTGPINRVGVPSPLLASKVSGVDGRDLRDTPGEVGEAVYRSPIMTAGYYRDEDATREAFRDGWFHSGDLCACEPDGGRVMLDREKDIVKSGGENVSSIRVESVIAAHPAVASCAVIGLPDDRWGEAVTACVVPAPGAELDPSDVVAHCRARLAGFESPKRVEIFDALPTTVGGKVLKHKLREQLVEAARGI